MRHVSVETETMREVIEIVETVLNLKGDKNLPKLSSEAKKDICLIKRYIESGNKDNND